MKLYAISDLHLNYEENFKALKELPEFPDDWLILGGDLGESEEALTYAFRTLSARFAKLLWVPGNHELWTMPGSPGNLGGEAKYERLLEICREYDVISPEDPYVDWPGDQGGHILCPLFLLYDYSFCPDHVSEENAVSWASESGVLCTDEALLKHEPHASKQEWCRKRVRATEQRLEEASRRGKLVLINHFPLRQDLVRLYLIPRFSIWCGTRLTEDWHVRFPVSVVVSGHLHMRSTDYRDGVRFEEVSLGYPRHWRQSRGMAPYLREILPASNP